MKKTARLIFDLIPCDLYCSWHHELNNEDRHFISLEGSINGHMEEGKQRGAGPSIIGLFWIPSQLELSLFPAVGMVCRINICAGDIREQHECEAASAGL